MILLLLALMIGGTTTGMIVANKENKEFLSHQHTWKGEMLCPPQQDNCNKEKQ